MNSTFRNFIETVAAYALLSFFPLVAIAAEPAWWTKQKQECGLPANLAYNSWDGRCGRSGQTPQLDPRQIALQSAVLRFNALVRSLADNLNVLDKQSWLNLPVGTEAEFFNAANQLHKILVNLADGNHFRVGKLREELAEFEEVIETYPGLIASLRTDIERARLEHGRLANALQAEKRQLELTQRVSNQLETRAHRYQEDVNQDKSAVLSWFAVLLPPGMAETGSPKPYEGAVDWAPSVRDRQPVSQVQARPQSIDPVRVRESKFGIRLEINPSPLAGTAENAVAQLEADAVALRAASAANSWDLANKVSAKRPVYAQFRQMRGEALGEREKFQAEVAALGDQLKVITETHLQAEDNLQAAKATLLYRAAESWIWNKAKTEAIAQVKNETKRLVASKWFGVSYRDLADDEMHALFSAGKRNIFGLGEKALSMNDGLYPVLNRIKILQTHGQGYMQEAVRLASLGSPREILEFVDGMFKEMGDDSEKLVKANLAAVNIPEPFKSISAKYFIKTVSE